MAKKKTLDELRTETAEEENRQRTHNLCCLGGLVLKYFGKDISVEEFSDLLEKIFSIKEVKELVFMTNETDEKTSA